jgi:hypothetical protein
MNIIQWQIIPGIAYIPFHLNKKFAKANDVWYNPYNKAMR